VVSLWENNDRATNLGNAAFKRLQNEYSSNVVKKQWLDLLTSITTNRKV